MKTRISSWIKSSFTKITKGLVIFLLLIGITIKVHGQSSNICQSLIDQIGGTNAIQNDYNLNKKWVAYFYIKEISPSIQRGVKLIIDLDDIAGVTAEGRDGWVTVWVDVTLSAGWNGIPIGFGVQLRSFGANAPDSPIALFDLTTNASVNFMPVQLFSVTSSGGTSFVEPKLGSASIASIGEEFSIHGLSFEMRSEVLNELMRNGVTPGVTVAEYAKRVINWISSPTENSIPLNPFLNFRFTTPQDDPEEYLIQDIYSKKLVEISEGCVNVTVKVKESNYYYVRVWGTNPLNLYDPFWNWSNKWTDPVYLEANQGYNFQLYVTPDSRSKEFSFWLYQKDIGELYKIIEKVNTTLYADPIGTDITPPVVSFISPSSGTTVSNSVNVIVQASDAGSGLSRVELLLNDKYLDCKYEQPFNFLVNTIDLAAGNFRLKTRAYDKNGNGADDILDLNNSVIKTSFYNGTISPASGNTSTNFLFSVYFKDTQAPQYVKTIFSSGPQDMSGSGTYSNGVQFTTNKTFSTPGTYTYYFEAKSANNQALRYPSSGSLSLTVIQSAVGWEASVDPLNTTYSPASIAPGTTITVNNAVKNTGTYDYTNIEGFVEMRYSNGNLIKSAPFSTGPIAKLTTRIVPPINMVVPTDALNGTYTLTSIIYPTLDQDPSNNSFSNSFYIGESLGNEQFRAPNGLEVVNYHTNLNINGKAFYVYGLNTSTGYATMRDPSGNMDKVYNGRSKVYGSFDSFIACDGVFDDGAGGYAALLYGAYAISNGPVFDNVEINASPGQTVYAYANAPSGFTFINNSGNYELFSSSSTDVKAWYNSLSKVGTYSRVKIRFDIPSTTPVGKRTVYFLSQYSNTYTSDFTRLTFNITNPVPVITLLSKTSFSADDKITITGSNLGSSGTVKFGELVATISNWTNTSITCRVPEGVQDGVVTVINTNGASNGLFYKINSSTGDPIVVQPIPDQKMHVNDSLIIVNLANVFSDPNGDQLFYSTTSSSSHVKAVISNGSLIVSTDAQASGSTQIIVSATDLDNVTIKDTFLILIPTIIVSQLTLSSFGNVAVHSNSLPQNYTVTGNNLSDNILVTAPIGFQVSTSSSSGFESSVILTQIGGNVNSTTIFIRFSPTTLGSYSDNIIHSSSGANVQFIAVNGDGTCSVPTPSFIDSPGNSTCANTNIIYTTQGGQLNYVWTLPGVLNTDYTITSGGIGSTSNTVTLKWLVTGSKTVTVNYSNASGCQGLSPAMSVCTIYPLLPVSISVSPTANPVCAGTSVTYNATPTNGGTTPAYQWKKNGTNVGTNSPSYEFIPVNNDVITCVLTSNATCVTGSPATSNAVTMTINPLLPVSISVSPSANPVCAGISVTYTATPTNGGTTPAYQWKKNGTNVGSSNLSYAYTPENNDVITCVLTSNATCATGSPATSNAVTMTVNPLLPVSISVSPSANPVCAGTSVTYTATPTNGGTTPAYQWKKNGTNVGTNSPSYEFIPVNNDVIICVLTSNATCVTGSPATSNAVNMTVNLLLPVSISVSPSANPVCAGTSVTYTATPTNGGTTPAYQWKKNGTNAGTNSPSYEFIPVNNDVVTCVLTSNATCVTGSPATSNSVTMTVNPLLPVSISVSPSANPVCAGTSVTYTATPTSGGTTPAYQWKKNGTNVGANSPSYEFIPVNNDVITCVLTSNAPCATGSPATSNTSSMSVNIIPDKPRISMMDRFTIHSDTPIGNQWYNNNVAISGATLQDYIASPGGDYYVIVTINGCSSEPSEHIFNVGLKMNGENRILKIYPNPLTHNLTIELKSNTKNTEFKILNSLGQVVYSGSIVEEAEVDASSFKPGAYMLKLENGRTVKFIKLAK